MILFLISISFLYSAALVALAARFGGFPYFHFKNSPNTSIPAGRMFGYKLVILSVSIYFNLFLSVLSPIGDTSDFIVMMEKLTKQGFYGYYQGGGIQYPPLFQYLFYLMAQAMRFLNIPFDRTYRLYVFCVKLPCIICIFLMAFLIYRTVKKHAKEGQQILILFLTLLNPGYFLVTSYICQVDALYICLMLLTVCLVVNRRLKLSYFSFAAAVLFKFQAVFITPVLIFAILDQVILHDFSWKRFLRHLLTGISAIALMAASYLPFIYDFETGEFASGGFAQNFANSIQSFGKASQNAYNFWTLAGYNEVPHSKLFGPLTCHTWGTVFIFLVVLLSAYLWYGRREDSSIYPMLGALLVCGTYCFAVKMMSRYLYPALPLLFLGYAQRPTKKRLISSISLSVGFFLAAGFDYLVYPWRSYTKELIWPYIVSFYVILCFLFLVYTIWSEKGPDSDSLKQQKEF